MALISGWGRGSWSEGAWNEPIPAEVTGVSASGQVGTVAVTGSAIFAVTGVSADGVVGRVGQAVVWGKVIPDPGNTWTDVDPSAITIWTPIAA
jgi:hypothetical protein